jgi:MFS family permease
MAVKIKNFPGSIPGPPLFYNCIIIISGSLAMMACGGLRGGFGVFFRPMADDFGWSAALLSSTFSLSMIVEGTISAISGRLSDKIGTRPVLAFNALISGAGFILMALVHSIWQMYLIYGLVIGIGLGGIVVPVVSIMARRFPTKRALMTGIVLSAHGVGQILFPLLAYQLITVYNWRTSYVIFGIGAFIMIGISALFLKQPRVEEIADEVSERPIQTPAGYTFKEALHTRLFWLMLIMFTCYGFCFISVLVHIVPNTINLGISPSSAANVLSCMGGASIAGRLGLGTIADRIGNRRMIMIGFILLVVSLIWLIQAKNEWSLFLFAIVGGLGLGGISSSQSPLSAQYFGSREHGSIFGMLGGGTIIISSIGPVLTGYLFDLTGNYQASFIVCVAVGLAGLIICMSIKHPVRSFKGNIGQLIG